MKVCCFARALLPAMLVFSISAGAAPLPGPIDCDGTPFGRRLPIGLDQEFVVVHSSATGTTALQSFVVDDPNVGFGGLVGVGNVATFATPASIQTSHVDLDGDGRDEWAVAGVKPGNAKVVVVTTFRYDAAQSAFVGQGPVWEYTLAANIADVRVAAADVTGRDTNTRQELAVAVRDATGKLTVFVLTGAPGNPGIQQPSNSTTGGGYWTMPIADAATGNLRMTTGDVLLEGRDQIVLMATATNASTRVYYVLRYDDVTTDHLGHTRFSESRPTGGPLVFDVKAADFGGSPAAELLVHDEGYSNDSPESLKQDVRYFTTTRDPNSGIITGFAIHSAPSTNTIDSQGRQVAVAVGQLDRRPGAEIAVARQQPTNNGNHLLVDLYKVAFDVQGNPAGVVAYGSPQRDDVMYKPSIDLIDTTIRDQFGTGVGEVVVAALDQAAQNDTTPSLKVNTYAMATPAGAGIVDASTFARTSATSWPTLASGSDLAVHVDRIDFDGDSVLADLGTTCQRVREPMLRTVVHLPPYWDRLQGPGAASGWSDGFVSTIGQTKTHGTTSNQQYSTSTSHDVSGYIGVTVGGDVLGIGVEASVKATAGYTYESARGESVGTDDSVSVGESQSQSIGEGLVVVESNMFECYSYDVHVGGVFDSGSNVRSCEMIRKSGNDDLRSFTPSDLATWDTVTASGNGQGQPGQWIPLEPDWASVALFHVPTANFVPVVGSSLAAATDGHFDTFVESPAMARPHIDIDIGRAQPLTNIRVFPASGHPGDLDGFYVYVSTQPFSGSAPPSGPNVHVYAPDAKTGNGFDHWNIWLRDLQTQAAPIGRYVRLQSPGTDVKTLRLSDLQVFADTHVEPPGYPQAVCDPARGDGLFTALMYDAGTPGYRKVDVRGQLLWTSAPTDASCGTDFADTDAQHKDGVQHTEIWRSITVGGTGSIAWDLTDATSNVVGSNTSISHSARVGAEVDVEAGAVVKANIGGAYEFSTGVTQESETTMYWGSELLYAGGVGGFQPLANDSGFVTSLCEYRTHPFAYTTSERSNVGYEQQFTVVDYVVRDLTWSRQSNPPPARCYTTPPDTLFRNSFE